MADDGIYTTNALIANFAGANVNSTAVSVAETDKHVLLCEAQVNMEAHFNYSTGTEFADLLTGKKELLQIASACLNAELVIKYDMSKMGTFEGQTRVDILRDIYTNAIKILKEGGKRDFLNKT